MEELCKGHQVSDIKHMEAVRCDTPKSVPKMSTTQPCVFRMPCGQQHYRVKNKNKINRRISRSCLSIVREGTTGFQLTLTLTLVVKGA